jgi:hypothetical protein
VQISFRAFGRKHLKTQEKITIDTQLILAEKAFCAKYNKFSCF